MNRRTLLLVASIALAAGFAAYQLYPPFHDLVAGFIATVSSGWQSNPLAAVVPTGVIGTVLTAVAMKVASSGSKKVEDVTTSLTKSGEDAVNRVLSEKEEAQKGFESQITGLTTELSDAKTVNATNAESMGKLTESVKGIEGSLQTVIQANLAKDEQIKSLMTQLEATKNALEARVSGADGRG